MTWLIKRNCSASPKQLAWVFASLVAVSFLFGGTFAAFGLWMVLPFVGLEILAVAAAFLIYGRHAADIERIDLAAGRLTIERIEADRCSRWESDSRRVRVEVEELGRVPGARVRVHLATARWRIEVGRYLVNEKRAVLAHELRAALGRRRALRHEAVVASGVEPQVAGGHGTQ